MTIDEELPFEEIPFQDDEELPFVNDEVYWVKRVCITNYGNAKRLYEEFVAKANDALMDSTMESDDAQAEIDKWQKYADDQKAAIEKFEKSCAQFDSKYLGENIKIIAKKHNLKIPDVENLVGISPGYISRTINPESKKRLSIDVVWQISKLFSINMSDLLERDLKEPPKTVTPVVQFLEKLNHETSEADIHWKSLGNSCNNSTAEFFSDTTDKDGNATKVFSAPQDDWFCSLKGNIYAARLNGRTIYIMEVDCLFGDDGILIYTEREVWNEFDQSYNVTELLCSTMDDSSGILLARATELMNSIKLHERDFTVSDDAKSFIDNYLNPVQLPFE